MDLGDDILNGIVAAIASKSQVKGWNTCRLKNGQILIKIRYDGDKKISGNNLCDQDPQNSEFNPQQISYKKLSENQCKRQFHRAKRFRESPIEKPRCNFDTEHSAATPIVYETPLGLDQSACEPECPENSVSHVESSKSSSLAEPADEAICVDEFHDAEDQSHMQITEDRHNEMTETSADSDPNDSKYREMFRQFNSMVSKQQPQFSAEEFYKCSDKNCSYGPSPESIDSSVIGIDNNILRCPKCDVPVCLKCRKYRRRHKNHFTDPP